MPYDYSKLAGRIMERLGSQKAFAAEVGLSERSVSLKMTNAVGWKQQEMARACVVLGLELSEIPEYFYILKEPNE